MFPFVSRRRSATLHQNPKKQPLEKLAEVVNRSLSD
jgi:hypothetical protein